MIASVGVVLVRTLLAFPVLATPHSVWFLVSSILISPFADMLGSVLVELVFAPDGRSFQFQFLRLVIDGEYVCF